MKYALLGDTGLAVSRVTLGAMTFTMGNSEFPTVYKVDEQLADHLVGRALNAGVNFFDTADAFVSLTGDEVSALDRATPLVSVYPNWVIDGFGDSVLRSAMARPETQ
jgi:predicted aldo/keto reductase-like oxidoreductase